MLVTLVPDISARHKLAAADIEAACTLKQILTWPHYAINAADGMRPFFVLEVGYCRLMEFPLREQRMLAVQVAENLTEEKKTEATTGMCGRRQSLQFGVRCSVNRRAYTNVEWVGRTHLLSKQTAELARRRCIDKLRHHIILTHNSSGFDERALLRLQLIELAGMYEARDHPTESPEQAIWTEAKKLRDDPQSQIPMLHKGFGPVRQVLDVFMTMLEDSEEHKELMEAAEQAVVRRLPGTLEHAFEVYADYCNDFLIHLQRKCRLPCLLVGIM